MKRLALVVLAVGCGDAKGNSADARLTDSREVDTSVMVDAPPAPRCDPTKPFGAVTVIPMVNSTSEDITPVITPDELQLWFSSNRPGSQAYDIYMATRTSKTADFGAAALVAGINTP